MKNNKKIILAAGAAALGLVAATGATSGFAWFTTNRTVTATLNSVTVGSNAASLIISNNVNLQHEDEGDNKAGNNVTIDAPTGRNLTDVSSADGVTFYTAEWGTTAVIGRKEVTEENGLVSGSLYAYVDYTLYVGQKTAQANKLDVYLSTIAVTVAHSDADLVKSARAAIFVADEASAAIIVNSGAGDNTKALAADGNATVNCNAVAATSYTAINARPTTEQETALKRSLFTTTQTQTGIKLTVRVWYEGTSFTNKEFPATAPTVTTTIALAAFDHVGA